MSPEPLTGKRSRAQAAIDGPLAGADASRDFADPQPAGLGMYLGRRRCRGALDERLVQPKQDRLGEQVEHVFPGTAVARHGLVGASHDPSPSATQARSGRAEGTLLPVALRAVSLEAPRPFDDHPNRLW